MSENWKPGDVAVVTTTDGQEVRAVRASDGMRWVLEPTLFPPRRVADARRLVVIDPDNAHEVGALADLFFQGKNYSLDAQMAALREFANPVVKPEEPTGLGAVVEDAEGRRWTRAIVTPDDVEPWYREDILWGGWSEIAVTRILSPGVTND